MQEDEQVASGGKAVAEEERRAVDRLTFFSDAVVAIAITLLAIDLPVPRGLTVATFWTSVRENSGSYFAFVISFLVIAGAWSHHHDIFRSATKLDSRLRQLNMTWLMMIILTPFATRLLTPLGQQTLSAHALRFGFYALLQALESGVLLAILRHMLTRQQAADTPKTTVADLTAQSAALIAGFGVSIPVFFVTSFAWILWIAVPMFGDRTVRFLLPASRGRKR